MPDVELTPGVEFAAVAARLRGAPANIRKELNTAIKATTAPAEADLKRAALGIRSKGVRGSGSKQRSMHNTTASGKLPKHTGLRANIARGVQRKITYTGYRTGVRIRVDGKYLPDNSRQLIGLSNSGKPFRHPVMGRDTWVTQSFGPGRWFDDTMKRHTGRIQSDISAAAKRAMEQLQ